jgi:hypothetical protein
MSENIHKVEIVDDKRSGLATASMILGIIAIIGCWIPFLNIFSIIMGFIGLALGIPAFIVLLTKKKGSMGKTIAGLVLCLITVIVGINMNNAAGKAVNDSVDEINGNKTEDILKNDIEVNFGTYTTDGNEYYESGKLEVTVKNKTDDVQSYTISVEALDSEGVRITTDTIYANDLGAGQAAKYDTFSYGDVDKLKTAVTFKVYEVSKY